MNRHTPDPLAVPPAFDEPPSDVPRGPGSGLVRKVGWSSLAQVLPLLVVLVTTPFIISHIGVNRFGVWSLLTALLAAATGLDGGLSAAVLRFSGLAGVRGDRAAVTRLLTTVVTLLLGVGGAAAAAVWVLAPRVVELFHVGQDLVPDAVMLLRGLMPLVVLQLLANVFGAQLEAHGRFKALAVRAVLVQSSYLVVVLVTLPEYGLRGLLAATVARNGLSALVAAGAAAQHLSLRSVRWATRAELRPFGAFAARLQATSLAGLVMLQADAFVVAALLPIRYVGYYGAAAQLAAGMRTLPVFALPPIYSHLVQRYGADGLPGALREAVSLQRSFVRQLGGYLLLTCACAYSAVFAWLGPEFRIAGAIAVVLAVGNAMNVCTGVLSTLARVVGRPGLETRYAIVCAVLNIVLTLPFGLLAGVYGIVAATAVAQIVGSLWFLRLTRGALDRDLPSFFRALPVLPASLCALVGGSATYAVSLRVPTGIIGLLCAGVPAALSLLAYVVYINRSGEPLPSLGR